MAVYGRGYRGYSGPLNPAWSRFLVIFRYGLRDAFRSRLFAGFFIACFVPPLIAAVIIYLHYNVEALSILQLDVSQLISIDSSFFRTGVVIPQSFLAFLLILVAGPALISPDLRNNAMPLMLSRPLDKHDYIAGKLAVVLFLASAITWMPGLVLFGLQSSLAGADWVTDHLRVAPALVASFAVWIVPLSLFSLAVSAWVKWKPWARIAFLGALLVSSAMGGTFLAIYGSWWGNLLIVGSLGRRVTDQLFGLESVIDMPALAAWIGLAVFTGVSTILLYRRIRAYEVVT